MTIKLHLTLIATLAYLSLALGGCPTAEPDDDDDNDDASADDDTGDDDTGDDDTVAASSAPAGQSLCAAGGRVSGKGLSGVICLSPVDLSSGARSSNSDGSLTWYAGPTTRIAP